MLAAADYERAQSHTATAFSLKRPFLWQKSSAGACGGLDRNPEGVMATAALRLLLFNNEWNLGEPRHLRKRALNWSHF